MKLAKKLLCLVMTMVIGLGGCGKKERYAVSDGKDRPSNRGSLQVIGTQLCGSDGEKVMLRGISNNSVALSGIYTNDETYKEISEGIGANVIRLALYTTGMGSAGYCTGSEANKESLFQLVQKGVESAKHSDMYVIIDWHVLKEGNPQIHMEEAKTFFARCAETFEEESHILYEICNEPNGEEVDWDVIYDYAMEVIPIIREKDPDSVIIVGTPNWSQAVDQAAQKPLPFDNLLYTLHFYSASHKEALRNRMNSAYADGLPIFVSEYGVCADSGGVPYDLEEADRWIEVLEENGISYVMWNFSTSPEASAALKYGVTKTKGFTEEDFTEAGLWLKKTIDTYTK